MLDFESGKRIEMFCFRKFVRNTSPTGKENWDSMLTFAKPLSCCTLLMNVLEI